MLLHFKKNTSSFKKYSNILKIKIIEPLPLFPPSLRLKKTQAKPASLIPPKRLQEISWQDFWRRHAPRALVQRISMSVRVSVLVVNGSLDLAARAIVLQVFLFHLAIQGAAQKNGLAATDESGQRRERCKALQGSRTMPLCRDTRPDLSFFARC